jgi:protein-S-isoprenylcysteine O-methyltransferase Ste14
MNTLMQRWWRGQRGEWFVIAQFTLLLAIILGPKTVAGLPPWPAHLFSLSSLGGVVLLVSGCLISLAAVLQLRSNLTPLPHPKDGATLVVAGMYRFVRHPIYLGVMLMATGFALFVQGWLTLGEAVILALFFDIKSRREEIWLTERFPDYTAYQRRVWKLIPFRY